MFARWKKSIVPAVLLMCLAGCLTACGSGAVDMEYEAETGIPSAYAVISTETTPEETEMETVPPVQEDNTTAAIPAEVTFVLNTNTKRYHLKECSSVAKIKPENTSMFSGTQDELIAQGYKPCGNCDP